MATITITTNLCDACLTKGEETEAVTDMHVVDLFYRLCEMHGERFRGFFAESLGVVEFVTKVA
ncbi:hypothetical protein ACWDUX_30440 [Streptomyces sp. NPDC003444]